MNLVGKVFQTTDKSGTLELLGINAPGPAGYSTIMTNYTAPGAPRGYTLYGRLFPPNAQQPRLLISVTRILREGYIGQDSEGSPHYARYGFSSVVAIGAPTNANGVPPKLSLQHSFVIDTDKNSEKLSVGTPTDYILQN